MIIYTQMILRYLNMKKNCCRCWIKNIAKGSNYTLDIVGVKLTNDYETLKSVINHFKVTDINYYGYNNEGNEPDKEPYNAFKKNFKQIKFEFFNSNVKIWKKLDDCDYCLLKKSTKN